MRRAVQLAVMQVRWPSLIVRLLILIAVGAALAFAYLRYEDLLAPDDPAGDAGKAAFDRWLAKVPDRRAQFRRFEGVLRSNGVDGIVPAWTILRADGGHSARCRTDAFALPPPALWPHMVRTLKLVRSEVVPAIGRVSVASAYRMPTLNKCARGARQSRHMQFHALDLVPLDQPDAETAFRKLCARWRRAGANSGWGLGAYYDQSGLLNRRGRFHVDATGWRTWGFSYHRDSSACNWI